MVNPYEEAPDAEDPCAICGDQIPDGRAVEDNGDRFCPECVEEIDADDTDPDPDARHDAEKNGDRT